MGHRGTEQPFIELMVLGIFVLGLLCEQKAQSDSVERWKRGVGAVCVEGCQVGAGDGTQTFPYF